MERSLLAIRQNSGTRLGNHVPKTEKCIRNKASQTSSFNSVEMMLLGRVRPWRSKHQASNNTASNLSRERNGLISSVMIWGGGVHAKRHESGTGKVETVLRLGSENKEDQPFGEWIDMEGRRWPPAAEDSKHTG
jgi:hypothetical protein